jgi:hypothetical protein
MYDLSLSDENNTKALATRSIRKPTKSFQLGVPCIFEIWRQIWVDAID